MLLLFDIDGTLLKGATNAHARALRVALHEVYGIGPSDGASDLAAPLAPAGRTDIEIARSLAQAYGCEDEEFNSAVAQLQARCIAEYEARVEEDLSSFVLPGIAGLLEELAQQADTTLSLLTGNLEGVARIKLSKAGLGRHFREGQGAFGSDSERRVDLPPIARERAGLPGAPHPREDTLVIGDTPKDIACARADGLRCIAVSTGPYRARELSGADAIAGDSEQLRELLLAQPRTSRL